MSATLGIENLLTEHLDWLAGQRVGLVSHPASLDSRGTHTAELLWQHPDIDLTALFGPEHGFFGRGDAGEDIGDQQHSHWDIPVFSLYGDTRKPTPEMLEAIDVIVVDLQDLAVRCYTYVSTLKLLLEAASDLGKTVIVCDRPDPLANIVDGPMLDAGRDSFVGCIETPLVYGMTIGEAALWIQKACYPDVDLCVIPMRDYFRASRRGEEWGAWVPPSPGIKSWETAWYYPTTVWCEALTELDCARSAPDAFRVLGTPWINGEQLAEAVGDLGGGECVPHRYIAKGKPYDGWELNGIRMTVTDPDSWKPVEVGVRLLAAIQELCGVDKVWDDKHARPDFFDKLMGTDEVRLSLQDGKDPQTIIGTWSPDTFRGDRDRLLLY